MRAASLISARLAPLASALRAVLVVYSIRALEVGYSILANLAVPLFAAKEDFASYRIVILYAGYHGFLHLGLLDGFYLSILGRGPEDLGRELLRRTRRALFALLAVTSLAAAVLLSRGVADASPLLITCVVAAMCLLNLITFHNYLYLGTAQIGRFGKSNLIGRISALAVLGLVLLFGWTQWPYLAIAFLLPIALQLVYYELTLRRTEAPPAGDPVFNLSASWRRGVRLYSANIIISLVFTAGALVASMRLDLSHFADFAYAFGFITIVAFATEGLVQALAPILKRSVGAGAAAGLVAPFVTLIWLMPLVYWFAVLLTTHIYRDYAGAAPLLLPLCAALPLASLLRSWIVSFAITRQQEGLLLSLALGSASIMAAALFAAEAVEDALYALAYGWSAGVTAASAVAMLIIATRFPKARREALALLAHAVAATGALLLGTRLESWGAGAALCVICAVGGVALALTLHTRGNEQAG